MSDFVHPLNGVRAPDSHPDQAAPPPVTSMSTAVAAALLVLAHVPLALLAHSFSTLAQVHLAAVFSFGLFKALGSTRLLPVACVAAYITGAEVFWRMLGAVPVWEFAKYAVVLIIVVAMFRRGRFAMPLLPLVAFALLMPSVMLTAIGTNDLRYVREQVSFNLGGHLTLLACLWLFHRQILDARSLMMIGASFLAPVTAIFTIALFATLTTPLDFRDESNFATSGGFGPNQVSSVLGAGVLMAFLLLFALPKPGMWFRAFLAVLLAALLFQSVLTFSRTGLYLSGAGVFAASMFWLAAKKLRARLVLGALVVVVLSQAVILPQLMQITGGRVVERFTETDPTGRDDLIVDDVRTFSQFPLLGVGPGLGNEHRTFDAAAHTEFARLLAEHGILGLIALLLYLTWALRRLATAATPLERGLYAGLMAFAGTFMMVSAMRQALPAFLFGLVAASLALEPSRTRRR